MHTEFNREKLKEHLANELIYYVFLGDKCGARVEDLSCYVDGQVDFKKVARLPEFQAGLARILEGARQFPIALMCAEKDPITCHRTILICKELYKHNLYIKHILHDGGTEDHSELEKRLLKLFNLDQHHLLKSKKDSLDEAYERQGKKIAYQRYDEQLHESKENQYD
jgi:uncharacterized protein (DUF488 family)